MILSKELGNQNVTCVCGLNKNHKGFCLSFNQRTERRGNQMVKAKSAKQKAQQARFKKAFKATRAKGIKPFTKAFGAEMKKQLTKK